MARNVVAPLFWISAMIGRTFAAWRSALALRAVAPADGWRCLSLSWRAPMREPEEERVPVGIPLPDLTMDEYMDVEDSWSARQDRV